MALVLAVDFEDFQLPGEFGQSQQAPFVSIEPWLGNS